MSKSAAQTRSTAMHRELLLPSELRARRRALGLTQVDLAAELDVSANTVARWERGELQIGHPRRAQRRLEELKRSSSRHPRQAAARESASHLGTRELPRVSNDGEVAIREPARPALPDELSSFVGRQVELHQLRDLLRSTRLLTLLGAGGIGKTRLALELLRALQADTQGAVCFADLSSLTHPDLVPQGVALALGIREQPGRRLIATLVDALESRVLAA